MGELLWSPSQSHSSWQWMRLRMCTTLWSWRNLCWLSTFFPCWCALLAHCNILQRTKPFALVKGRRSGLSWGPSGFCQSASWTWWRLYLLSPQWETLCWWQNMDTPESPWTARDTMPLCLGHTYPQETPVALSAYRCIPNRSTDFWFCMLKHRLPRIYISLKMSFRIQNAATGGGPDGLRLNTPLNTPRKKRSMRV